MALLVPNWGINTLLRRFKMKFPVVKSCLISTIYLPIDIGPPTIPYPISEMKRVSICPFCTASSICASSRISTARLFFVLLIGGLPLTPVATNVPVPLPKISIAPSWIKTGLIVEVVIFVPGAVPVVPGSCVDRFFRCRRKVEDLRK